MTVSDEKFVYTACPGWGDHEYCAIKTIVKDGKIVRTEHADYTGPEASEGFICQKGITSGRHPYLPGRLLHPLKRIGERGEGKWQEISWDQAMDEIGAKLVELRDKYGPETLMVWNQTASVPPAHGLGSVLLYRFAGLWGAIDHLVAYGLDNGPLFSGYYDWGNSLGYSVLDPQLLQSSKYVIVWGANPIENQERITRHLVLARDKGCKIVDIGLVYDGTAGYADWFIPVKPGSDTALALSMANVIVSENLYDKPYVLRYSVAPFLVREDNGLFMRDVENNYLIWDDSLSATVSVPPKAESLGAGSPALFGVFNINGVVCKPAFQKMYDHLKQYTPEAQEAITGVSAADVRKLTHEYMSVKPALLMGALGLRYQNQGESYRAMALVALLSGNIGVDGGGITCALVPSGHPVVFNDFEIMFPHGPQNNKTRYIRQCDWIEQIQTGKPWPIKALFKTSGNPVHNCPNRGLWVDKLFPNMELIVDYDIWMTDTGEQADYVLPDCTSFERMELIVGANYNHIVLQEPAIEPLGEAKDPAFLFRELSKRVGLGEYFDKTTEEWLELRLKSPFPMIATIDPPVTLERLKKEKLVRANVPETPNNVFGSMQFSTPSGRIEYYAETLAVINEAMAVHHPPYEAPDGKMDTEYPYQFFTGRQRFFMQSMFTDDPVMVKLSGGEPLARMNPMDAARQKIKDLDLIECYNQRGKVRMPVRLDEAIPPGTVHVWFGWRKRHFEEGTYAELLVPIGARETIDELAEHWWNDVEKAGKVGNMFLGLESALAGAWDVVWDCACDVRKVNGKNGGQS